MFALTRYALLGVISLAAMIAPLLAPAVYAQSAVDATATAAALPEPIYWKQTLFLIPYQFSSAAEPAAAQAVWLLVSKDRGANWQKISEAKPHVKSFNYRAEGDGEYWFAIRTLDRQGRSWPTGAYEPELRVIVDTTMPRIEALRAQSRPDGAVDIWWHGSDTNLDAATWKIEAQSETDSAWQSVPLESRAAASQVAGVTSAVPSPHAGNSAHHDGMSSGGTTWQPSTGPRPVRIRASITDRAGNAATYCAQIEAARLDESAMKRLPGVPLANERPAVPATSDFAASASLDSRGAPEFSPVTAPSPGWASSSTMPPAVVSLIAPPVEHDWQPSFVRAGHFNFRQAARFQPTMA